MSIASLRVYRLLFFFSILLAFPANAHANIPLPTIFGLGLPAWLGFATIGLSLAAVVVVEMIVLHYTTKLPWGYAWWIVLRANALSTALGFCLSVHPMECFSIILFPVITAHLLKKWTDFPQWKQASLALPTGPLMYLIIFPWGDIPTLVIQIYASIGFAFLLTIFFESLWLRKMEIENPLRRSIYMNGASYALLIAFLFLTGFRSGAIADDSWLTWKAYREGSSTSPDRDRIIVDVQELLEWRETGLHWKGALPIFNSVDWYPLFNLIREWNEEGHQEDARELYAIIVDYTHRNGTNEWTREELAEVHEFLYGEKSP